MFIVLGYFNGTWHEGSTIIRINAFSYSEKNEQVSKNYVFLFKGILIFFRHDYPMLVAQWQDGVTRRDLANAFTFEDFNKVPLCYS
jgi:hypothetical protein